MTASLEKKLTQRESMGNLRKLKIAHSLIDFASNDYLGLSRSPELRCNVLNEWQSLQAPFLGSTGSRLLTGNYKYTEELEEKIATFHGYESGLIFSSGYMANVGLISAIANEKDVVFFDTHIHASLHDGILLSKARSYPFRHNDAEHLETRLKKAGPNAFVIIESLYSMDGSFAPIDEITYLCNKYEAHLIVDEAHAIGVFGPYGKGLIAEKNLQNKIFAQICTFGKALGAHGAIVLGSHFLKKYLLNFAKSCVYSTALPLYTLAAIKCSYELLPLLEKERSFLFKLISLFKNKCKTSSSTIHPFICPGNENAKNLSHSLSEKGFDARAILSPTVQRGREQLRICLHSFNTEQEVNALSEALCKR